MMRDEQEEREGGEERTEIIEKIHRNSYDAQKLKSL